MQRFKNGFAFTDAQMMARWDALGGPTRVEKWESTTLGRFLTAQLAVPLVVLIPFAAVLMAFDQSPLPAFAPFAGWCLGLLFYGRRKYTRRRALMDRWRRRQEARGRDMAQRQPAI